LPASDSAIVVEVPNPDAYSCSQPGNVGFEGLPDGTNLSSGMISGVQFSTTNGFTWRVGDFATQSYNGKFPAGGYTSHGTHWAWLGETQGAGRIDFPAGRASYFSLLVSDFTPVYLEAYDANNVLLATAGPAPANYGTGHMTELKITRASADMAYVMVHDSGNYFLIDDVCTNAPNTPNTIKRVADQTYFMQTGQRVSGSFLVDLVTGARQFLRIFLGPFFSDVDLKLTRPDGSVVSQVDAGTTYTKTDNSVEVLIENAAAGTWQYEIIANRLDIPGGEDLHLTADVQTILQSVVQNELPNVDVGADASIAEGVMLTQLGSFTDPDADIWTATVDYGDGSGVQPLALNTDKSFDLNHVYTEDGTYTAMVTVDDGQGGIGTDELVVTVNNVAPQVLLDIDTTTVSCGVENALLGTAVIDPGSEDALTVTIDWGDGSPPESFAWTSSGVIPHTYARAGTYTAIVTAEDDDGGVGTEDATFAVNFTVVGGGVRPPIHQDGTSVFKYKRTIPVKVKLADCDGTFRGDLAPAISLELLSGSPSVLGINGVMRFDPTEQQYIYNLATKPLPDPSGTYRIRITIPATGQSITADFELRP
jgi:hypothetical protein